MLPKRCNQAGAQKLMSADLPIIALPRLYVFMAFFHASSTASDVQTVRAIVADVAKAAGIEHFVHSSVLSASQWAFHFDSKVSVTGTRPSALPYTILRPVFFHNYNGMRPMTNKETASQPLSPEDGQSSGRVTMGQWLLRYSTS